jgi:hypothetical protein
MKIDNGKNGRTLCPATAREESSIDRCGASATERKGGSVDGWDGGKEIEPNCEWRRRWSWQRLALMEIRRKTGGDVMDNRG